MATEYASDKIRNVVLMGHSHDGKTMLAEAMLFASGTIPRMGAPDQSTATTDFEPEEHKRKISINLGVAFAEHNGYKLNILDAPGFFDFAGQVFSALRVAEGAVVGGIVLSLAPGLPISPYVTTIAFVTYLGCRVLGVRRGRRRRDAPPALTAVAAG